jgi:hypothetical protein
MADNEAQKAARDVEEPDEDMGPTEKLREQDKSEADTLIMTKAGVPGVQKPENKEIKDEIKPNTE